MKLKFIHGALLGLAIALFLAVDGCRDKKYLLGEIDSIHNYKDTAILERTKSGKLMALNTNLQVSLESLYAANDSLKDYISDIRISDPESITIIEGVTKYDTIRIPIYLTDCVFDTTFIADSNHYYIDGRITNRGLTLNSLEFHNKMGLVIGYKKGKWWKRKERVATVTNTNPYIKVVGISSFSIKDDSKWFQKPLVQFGIGIITGGTLVYFVTR